jgi:hypothetical protein
VRLDWYQPITSRAVWLDTNNNGKLDANEPNTKTDKRKGTYSFANLAPGTYTVRIQTVTHEVQTLPKKDAAYTLTVAYNKFSTDNNFMLVPPGTSSVTGTIFNDRNGDGVRDDDESPLSGVTVYLDTTDSVVPGRYTAKTDSSGAYEFAALHRGTYLLSTSAKGFRKSSTELYLIRVLFEFQDIPFEPVGLTSRIRVDGTVFNDANRNGTRDDPEDGIFRRTVFLDVNGNGKFESSEPSTTTNLYGEWTLDYEKSGTFSVMVAPDSKYVGTSPADGKFRVTLAAGGVKSGLNFGQRNA